jgi:hypothetical protein
MTKFLELDGQSALAVEQSTPQEPETTESKRLEGVATGEAEQPESASLEVAATETPYEVCQEGPLTYFHYYFDAPNQLRLSAPRIERSTKPNYLSPGLLGAGVLTATVASGVLIANAVSEKPATPTNSSPDSQVKQTTTQKLPKPTTTAPEKLSQPERLLSQRANPSAPAAALSMPAKLPPKPNLTAARVAQALNTAPVAIAAPESFGFTPLLPSQLEGASQPTRSEAAATPAVPTAPPATAPAAPSVSAGAASGSPTNTPTNNSVPPGNLPAQVPAPAFGQPNLDAPLPAPNSPLVPSNQEPEAPSLPMQPVSSDRNPSNLETESPERSDDLNTAAVQDENPTTGLVQDIPSESDMSSSSQLPSSPQTLQDFINLANQSKGIEVKLMSLTQQAASEVLTANQVGAFTVRKLPPEAYRSEWQVSSNTPIDPANSFTVPTYGFIDYQRQVIAVLQEASDAESLKSAGLEATTSQPAKPAAGSVSLTP